jgi:drug/metabolite transporter (DMT)-like permease
LFNNNQLDATVNEMFWYVDIWLFFFMLLAKGFIQKKHNMNILDFKVYKQNKSFLLAFLFVIFTSNLKAFIMNKETLSLLSTYSVLSPFIAFIIVKIMYYISTHKEDIKRGHLIGFLLALIGYIVIHKGKVIPSSFSLIILGYVFAGAISDLLVRKIAKKRRVIDGIFAENMICIFFGVFCFIIFGNFKLEYLFSWQVVLVAIPTLIHHIFLITGHQRTENVMQILFLNLFKYNFVFFADLLFFDIPLTLNKVLGLLIISSGIVFIKRK